MFSIEELKLIKEELKINEDKYSEEKIKLRIDSYSKNKYSYKKQEEIIKEKKLKDPIKNIIKEYE